MEGSTRHGRIRLMSVPSPTCGTCAYPPLDSLYRFILQNVQDLVSVVDASGSIQFVSPSCARILGFEESELLGRDALEFLHPADRPTAAQILRGALQQPGSRHRLRFRHLRADGGYSVLEGVGSFSPSDSTTPLGIVCSRDVTDEEHWEAEMRTMQERVARSRRLESIGSRTGGIAHDFNNVLQSIVAGVELVRTLATEDRELHAALASIERSVQGASAMVRQLLREEPGPRGPVDLRAATEEAARLAKAALPPGADLRWTHSAEPCLVAGDAGQLLQAVMNLAINAAQSIPADGRGEAVQIDCSPWPIVGPHRGEQVRVRVLDRGVGMAPGLVARIFEPFFSTKPSDSGTGLGLATALGIIEAHGGRLRVHSRAGRGTAFSVFLPRADAVTGAQPPPLAPPPVKILLTGDDRARMALLEEYLSTRMPVTVSIARPDQALDRLRREPDSFHSIVFQCEGVHLECRRFAELLLARNPLPPLLFCGWTQQDLASIRVPADAPIRFLPSPYQLPAVAQAIQETLLR